jgi:hypothetical protein
MENPHSYIFKTYATIASFYSSVNTLGGPIFLLLILPYRWLESGYMFAPKLVGPPQRSYASFNYIHGYF